MQFNKLIECVRAARSQAYARYSNFAVGAAVQCKSGTLFLGSNIENRSYGLTICAERVAIGNAISSGRTGFCRDGGNH